MSAKHTPTPWHLSQLSSRSICVQGSVDTFHGPVWGSIVHCEPCGQHDGEGRTWTCGGSAAENAAFIVKAVNCHEALVSALKAMPCYGCSTVPGDNSPDARKRSRGCITCRPARAALALTEDQSHEG